MYIYIYIPQAGACRHGARSRRAAEAWDFFYLQVDTPGLHNKIPAHKIFARVWVAQKSFFLHR